MLRNIRFGIDLGTTNSTIASCEGDETIIYPNSDQMNVTPSSILIEKSGRVIIGQRAYRRKIEDPENVATEFKRWMGQKDVFSFKKSGRKMSAEELSAEVLKSVAGDARRQTKESIDAAVITVPAAFGQLQCEATARAAKLAGIDQAPLLQEPIAAAIAYGIAPSNKNQRWLVFDLGGGTFDVALISTKDGRLRVLDQRGDNLLGGKDLDRLIVDKLLWPFLEKRYKLPNDRLNPASYCGIRQRLILKAEEAKIDLSTHEKATVSMCDLGQDEDNFEIECELEIEREELERICLPTFERCLELCQEIVSGAQMKLASLDRILLVGGPTQMPFLRSLLERRLGAPIDHSQDPMTVVARGAAIYASTLENQSATSSSITSEAAEIKTSAVLQVELAYEAITPDLVCVVEGKVSVDHPIEIQIDAQSGHWTSGWVPVTNQFFEIEVHLLEGRSCAFTIQARDGAGKPLQVAGDSFVIRHGLALTSPPLPHSIGAEVIRADGSSQLDVVFKRGTALPCLVTKMYQASKTLKPSEPDVLVIKLWEGEIVTEPSANDWVGCMQIESHQLSRPLPEGSPIEVTMAIDVSRHLTVEAYIPRLDEHFRETVYVPQREEKEFIEIAESLPDDVEKLVSKVDRLQTTLTGNNAEQLNSIRVGLEDLDISLGTGRTVETNDPDHAKRLVEQCKRIAGKLSALESGLDEATRSKLHESEIHKRLAVSSQLVAEFGTEAEQRRFRAISLEIDNAIDRRDLLSIKRIKQDLQHLDSGILWRQHWWVEKVLQDMRNNRRFTDPSKANALMNECETLLEEGDVDKAGDRISEVVRLIREGHGELIQEKAMRSGIRKS